MDNFYSLDKALLSLSLTEHKRFKKFLSSPYVANCHAHNKTIQRLYKLIKPYFISSVKYIRFNWNEAIKKTCNNCEVSSKLVSKIKSEFLNYVLEFLAYESFTNNKIHHNIVILEELQKRMLIDLFEHIYCFKNFKSNFEIDMDSFHYYKFLQMVRQHKEINGSCISNDDYETEYKYLLRFFDKERNKLLSKISIEDVKNMHMNYTDNIQCSV